MTNIVNNIFLLFKYQEILLLISYKLKKLNLLGAQEDFLIVIEPFNQNKYFLNYNCTYEQEANNYIDYLTITYCQIDSAKKLEIR